MKYQEIFKSLSPSQITYLLKQIEKITGEYASDVESQRDCLWRVADKINLFDNLDSKGRLEPAQVDEVFEFLIAFVAWFYLEKNQENSPDTS